MKFKRFYRHAANNRFEQNQLQTDILVSGSAESFNYFYTADGPPSDNRYFPEGESNYIKEQTEFEPDNGCGLFNFTEGGDVEEQIRNLHQLYSALQSNAGNQNSEFTLTEVKTQRDLLLSGYFKQSVESGELARFKEFIDAMEGRAINMLKYGIAIETGDFEGAKSALIQQSNYEEMNDFISVQEVNLRRLFGSEETPFKMSEEEELKLDQIAESDSPYRGYARALMFLEKGVRYYDEEEDDHDFQSELDVKKISLSEPIESESLVVIPNPVEGNTFTLNGDIVGEGDGIIEVVNSEGATVAKYSLSELSAKTITINSMNRKGVYYVRVITSARSETVKFIQR